MKPNTDLLNVSLPADSPEAAIQLAYKHNMMASLFLRSNKFPKAEEHYLKAVHEAEKTGLPYSNALVNLGNLFSQKRSTSSPKLIISKRSVARLGTRRQTIAQSRISKRKFLTRSSFPSTFGRRCRSC